MRFTVRYSDFTPQFEWRYSSSPTVRFVNGKIKIRGCMYSIQFESFMINVNEAQLLRHVCSALGMNSPGLMTLTHDPYR